MLASQSPTGAYIIWWEPRRANDTYHYQVYTSEPAPAVAGLWQYQKDLVTGGVVPWSYLLHQIGVYGSPDRV